MVECARLESVYAARYQGFESLTLRQMKERFKEFWEKYPKIRKTVGVLLIIIGLISILTPFTPVGFLLIVGLEMVGVGTLYWDKLKDWWKRN